LTTEVSFVSAGHPMPLKPEMGSLTLVRGLTVQPRRSSKTCSIQCRATASAYILRTIPAVYALAGGQCHQSHLRTVRLTQIPIEQEAGSMRRFGPTRNDSRFPSPPWSLGPDKQVEEKSVDRARPRSMIPIRFPSKLIV
jgi:hypothetical protein